MPKLIFQLNILVFLFICAFTIPVMLQQGMFMDGVLYASVAKNMAEGYGSFFEPRFSELGVASSPIFYEHPPLVFGLQSIFFKIFGSHFLSERIYSFSTLLLLFFLIKKLWNEISLHVKGIDKMDWLAVLIWFTIPLVYWGYQNNAQENTMGIFTMAAALFTIKYLFRQEKKMIWLVLAGFFTFLASYSKGLPGLFTLGIIPIHALVFRTHSIKQYITSLFVIIVIFGLCYALIFAYGPSREHLLNYINLRLLDRINDHPTVHSRFVIIERIFWELFYCGILALLVLFLLRKRLQQNNWVKSQKKWIIFFFLVGLSASAPVALTLVQKGFYILPSFPFFSIAIALLIAFGIQDKLAQAVNYQKLTRIITIVNIVAVVGISAISYNLYGTYSRHESLLKSVDIISNYVPKRSTIRIQKSMWQDWEFQCYMMRYGTYSLDFKAVHEYVITQDSIPPGFTLIEKLPKYQLYSRNRKEN